MPIVLKDRKLTLIFCLALLLRALFVGWGARIYYGVSQEAIFYFGDSNSYIWSFENWWNLGHYTFDFNQPDAAFGRLPGYPLFYGLHYVLVGPKWVGLAVASSQTILDSCSALLVFSCIKRLAGQLNLVSGIAQWTPYVGALLYATYPFTIVWVPIIGTETLATFLSLAWLAWLLQPSRTTAHFVGLGLLLVVAFYVREYLGILLPITCLYLLISWPAMKSTARAGRSRVAALLLVCSTFGALYVLWPIRNYAVAQRIILLKPVTAGYANFNVDMVSFRDWVLCWSPDEQIWLDKVITSRTVEFPPEVFASPQEAQQAQWAAQLAYDCGSSFYLYRQFSRPNNLAATNASIGSSQVAESNCNAEIQAEFTKLITSYKARHPIRYWLDVPAHNLVKAFFKSTQAADNAPSSTALAKMVITRGLFAWRSLLVILGFAGLLRYRKQRPIWPVALFAGFMYLFICVLARKLEMRYLLQADALLLIPAALMLSLVVSSFMRPKLQAANGSLL